MTVPRPASRVGRGRRGNGGEDQHGGAGRGDSGDPGALSSEREGREGHDPRRVRRGDRGAPEARDPPAVAEGSRPPAARSPKTRYGRAVAEALVLLWEASDRVCSKRLKPMIPTLLPALERHGQIAVDDTLRAALLAGEPGDDRPAVVGDPDRRGAGRATARGVQLGRAPFRAGAHLRGLGRSAAGLRRGGLRGALRNQHGGRLRADDGPHRHRHRLDRVRARGHARRRARARSAAGGARALPVPAERRRLRQRRRLHERAGGRLVSARNLEVTRSRRIARTTRPGWSRRTARSCAGWWDTGGSRDRAPPRRSPGSTRRRACT